VGRASGLLGSLWFEYGSEHCWASWGTAERAGAAEVIEIAANVPIPADATRAATISRARRWPQPLVLRECEFICWRATLAKTGKRCVGYGRIFVPL
jgi:hypothetical protein